MTKRLFSTSVLSEKRWKSVVDPVLQRAWLAQKAGRFPHAVLLTGPRGMGRELLAVELASTLVCDQAPWSRSPESRRLRAGHHPDFKLVVGEGKKDIIKIDRVREIIDQVAGRPFEGRRRVWLLDRVESRLEIPAANALLKVLEEPPAHVVFLLLVDNPRALLPTIVSRCSELKLPGPLGVAALQGPKEGLPPEISHRSMAGKGDELMAGVRSSMIRIFEGNTMAALHLAGVLGGLEFGFEIGAAVAVELGAEQSGVGDDYLKLATELLRMDQLVKAFSLRPQRQLTSIFLQAARGFGR